MPENASVRFFDAQFRRQIANHDFALNPFEAAALPALDGSVLDYGCGLGNLAVHAARQGCTVLALDASTSAIEHLRERAAHEGLPIRAEVADLRRHRVAGRFDAVVCIGLLMFFDCDTAHAQLRMLQEAVRPGGFATVNVLVEGTTYRELFDPAEHCLGSADALRQAFAGWDIAAFEIQEFAAPQGTRKVFATVRARRPAGTGQPAGGPSLPRRKASP
jgi:tellurite methyltransferase